MARKIIDWEAIEREYRLGQKSVRTIASEFNVTHVSILRHAKKCEWIQDKSEEIKQKTKAALLKVPLESTSESTTPTHEDINKAVQTNVEVIRGHRKDIQKSIQIVNLLSTQLNEAAQDREELEGVAIEETEGVDGEKTNYKRRNQLMKAVSLPTHSGILKDLSVALKNLIPLERQAFNIDDGPQGGDEITGVSITYLRKSDQ